ncbi:MAG: D-alanyl-D-alanine carboxypeptidase family protein [Pygmaiobacter massiliensis]
MHKKLISIFCAVALTAITSISAAAETIAPPALQAQAACLMDATTGQVLFEKNMDTQLPPASITKIMTVMLGVESGSWTDTVTMSHDAVYSVPRNSSHIALQEGEQLTLEQALMATMLPSANDAANGVAEFSAGSMEAFVQKMNERAAECGATNTHFVNANGLDDPQHLTTAHDMALITRRAMQSEEFMRVFGTAEYVIPPTNLQTEARNIGAGHKMMFNFTKYYDSGILGGKSGYTPEAGHTLVTAVEHDGRRLIAVVMNAPKNAAMYEDTVALFSYGFGAFTPLSLTAESLAEEYGEKLAAPTEPITVYLAAGVEASAIQKQFTVQQDDAEAVKVDVSLSVQGAEGLQYAKLGTAQLVLEPHQLAADKNASGVPITSQSQSVKEKSERSAPVRILLAIGRTLVIGVCIAVFIVVMVMFYIRVSYDLRRKRRIYKSGNKKRGPRIK